MDSVTPDQMSTFFYVLLAIIALIIALDKAIDIIKKWRTPTVDVEKKLSNDKNRLDAHDEAIRDLKAANEVQCNALVALLDHALHNGNSEQMEEAKKQLNSYLIRK